MVGLFLFRLSPYHTLSLNNFTNSMMRIGAKYRRVNIMLHYFAQSKQDIGFKASRSCTKLTWRTIGARCSSESYIITDWRLVSASHHIRRQTMWVTLQWRHNGRDGVSNRQPHHCLLNCLFRHRSKKISQPRVTGLCAGNSPVTGEFPAQRVSNAENVSIWWRHHDFKTIYDLITDILWKYIIFNFSVPSCAKFDLIRSLFFT